MLVQFSDEMKDQVQSLVDRRLVHEVHTSERRSYRGCRRRWHWVFQEFYYPVTTAKPLEFGVAFHNAMEVLYDPGTWKMDRTMVKNAAIQKFVETCNKQKKAYEDEVRNVPEEVETDFDERLELGIGMLNYYWEEVAPQYDEHLKPNRVEVEFIVPIQNPDDNSYLFCKCQRCRKTQTEYWDQNKNVHLSLTEEFGRWRVFDSDTGQYQDWLGLPVCLAGRIDLLAHDEHGDIWIVDWKTAARLSRGDASGQDRDEFLELDDQIGSYVMALRRKLGLRVRGFIYVELKKAYPQPPERNKVQRLGCWFSKNKQQPTDYDTYLKTVKEQDGQAYAAGNYNDILEYLKEFGGRFHGRYQVSKTDEELEEIERNLFYEASEMTSETLTIYPSSGRFTCSFCAFRQPCLEKNRQSDYQYLLDTMFEQREKHYWVKELSTDKQGGE